MFCRGTVFDYILADKMTTLSKWRFLAVVLLLPLPPTATRGNVYVTDVKLNGAPVLVTGGAPGAVTINYRLNEPATLGVTVNISSSTNIRTLTATNDVPGAVNTIIWDGNDSNGIAAPAANYLVSITAAAAGYTNWTQINSDTNGANYVFDPLGVAVNCNSNSPFYGRVFMDNATTGPNPQSAPGDNVTLLKLNADDTYPIDGPDGTGGYYGIEETGLPAQPATQKLRVGADDRLYMNDLYDPDTGFEEVVAFDMLLSQYQVVLNYGNYQANPFAGNLEAGVGWFSMDVTGAGTTNGLIWLGEWDAGGAGIWNWHLINGVADPNDSTGNPAVLAGGSLSEAASGGLMVDTNLDIFVGQNLTNSRDARADCMVFTNWNHGLAFNGKAVTNGTGWTAGGGSKSFLGVFDTTIDSRQQPKYVACALNGGTASNGIVILANAATNATVAATLDPGNRYSATGWDNAGNLYAVSPSAHLLRIFSPPSGSNQATTTAGVWLAPNIISVTAAQGAVTVTFTAARSDAASQFALQSADAVNGPFVTVPGATVTQVSPGTFSVSAAAAGPEQFYQIAMAVPE